MSGGDLFGDGHNEPIRHAEKVAELERELRLRAKVYPRQVERGAMSQDRADRQVAVLRAILEDFNVRPWPQTTAMVAEWLPKAESTTVHGVPATKLTRGELLAALALAISQLRKAGILPPEPATEPAPPATTRRRRATSGGRSDTGQV